MFQQNSAPAHKARETIKLLQRETPALISPDLWPPNSPDLNPINYKICGVMQDRVHQKKKWRTWTSWESDWLRSGPDCSRTWLTMPSTSGADACVPAFGLEEDILSICCDWLHYLPRIWFVKFVENCWFIVKQDIWFRLLLVFLFLTFHKVVQQHILGEVGSLLIILLHSSSNCVRRWKNCENWSIFSKDMDKSIVSPFLTHSVHTGLHTLYMYID